MEEENRPNSAGQYQKQLTGNKAFIPASLPPDPPIIIDGEMQTLLSKADRALGRLDGSIQTLPNPDLFMFMYIRKEAVLSSQIEGTQSSLDDVLRAEADILDASSRNDTGEVLNYVDAMNYGLARLKELPVSIRLIREIHARILRNVRGTERNPGEIRTTQNWIGPGGCTLNEATFVPPPPHEVAEHLGALETFIHQDTSDLPALIKIGLIHSQFETIHPFLDGNGRAGRLLITFLLCEQGILSRPVLYISHYFRKNQQLYYEFLQNVRDTGDWASWLKFFLEGVATVSNEATETARKIVSLREDHRQMIVDKFGRGAGNGLQVLERLYDKPIVMVKHVEQLLSISFVAANGIVKRFVVSGLLTEITGKKRNRRYRYGPYIDLFSDN